MRVYIKYESDEDYRFDFGFSDDLKRFEVTNDSLRVILKDDQDTTFFKPEWDWKITDEE